MTKQESNFKVIKAKVCPNTDCNSLIREEWTAAYEIEYCPMCGYGYSEEKVAKWLEKKNQR